MRLKMTVLLAFIVCFGVAQATEHGGLRAGAARVDITPPVNPEYPPSGKYAHERLYIRAIVLDNGITRAALIGADQGNLAEEVWNMASKQIAEELKCPVENIIMSATHTLAESRHVRRRLARLPPRPLPPSPPPSS